MSLICNALKIVWRKYTSFSLRQKNVIVSSNVYFNRNTIFEGNNVIHSRAVVSNSIIGRNTYVGKGSFLPNCKIGRFCSIASNVKVVSGNHPTSVFVSTCPSFYSTANQNGQAFVKHTKFNESETIDGYDVVIGNDVWIGSQVGIKGGVCIGDGAVIAMGAIVTKDIPPYAIVGGVPAKVIKYRFSEEQIESLLKIRWWDKPDEWLISNADFFENIDIFVEKTDNK